MTLEEATAAYIERFGGYPTFLLRGVDEEYIISALTACIESGKELEPERSDCEY